MYARCALCVLLLGLTGCMEGQKAEPLPRKSVSSQSRTDKEPAARTPNAVSAKVADGGVP